MSHMPLYSLTDNETIHIYIQPHSSTSCLYSIQVAMNNEVVKRSFLSR